MLKFLTQQDLMLMLKTVKRDGTLIWVFLLTCMFSFWFSKNTALGEPLSCNKERRWSPDAQVLLRGVHTEHPAVWSLLTSSVIDHGSEPFCFKYHCRCSLAWHWRVGSCELGVNVGSRCMRAYRSGMSLLSSTVSCRSCIDDSHFLYLKAERCPVWKKKKNT